MFRKTLLALVLVVAVMVTVAGTHGPYLFPVTWALGPCFEDWTSPSSYGFLTGARASPLETLRFELGSTDVQVCYGRPSARGRTLFGPSGLVPFGEYWRTGANEPTRIFTNGPIGVGQVDIAPGRYSIYTIPGPDEWIVVLNRSTFHWGHDFSESVVGQEVGRTTARVTRTDLFAEVFTITAQLQGAPSLVMEWGDVSVVVPLSSGAE